MIENATSCVFIQLKEKEKLDQKSKILRNIYLRRHERVWIALKVSFQEQFGTQESKLHSYII